MNIAFFYVEMGRPWWREAVTGLVESARATQPGCRLTHMADKQTGQFPGTDSSMLSDEQIDPGKLMLAKGWMWATLAQSIEAPTLLTDADVTFRRDMSHLFYGEWDVALLRRFEGGRAAAQPYLAAMAFTKPTQGARRFWAEYLSVLQSLPRAWSAWWCDQIAFAALLGAERARLDLIECDGYRVRLYDTDMIAPKIETPDCYAVHYKGRREEKNAA